MLWHFRVPFFFSADREHRFELNARLSRHGNSVESPHGKPLFSGSCRHAVSVSARVVRCVACFCTDQAIGADIILVIVSRCLQLAANREVEPC